MYPYLCIYCCRQEDYSQEGRHWQTFCCCFTGIVFFASTLSLSLSSTLCCLPVHLAVAVFWPGSESEFQMRRPSSAVFCWWLLRQSLCSFSFFSGCSPQLLWSFGLCRWNLDPRHLHVCAVLLLLPTLLIRFVNTGSSSSFVVFTFGVQVWPNSFQRFPFPFRFFCIGC